MKGTVISSVEREKNGHKFYIVNVCCANGEVGGVINNEPLDSGSNCEITISSFRGSLSVRLVKA